MDYGQLKKFLEGKCSAREAHEVLVWVHSEEGARVLGEEFIRFKDTEDPDFPSEEIFRSILGKIEAGELVSRIESDLTGQEGAEVRLRPEKKRKNPLGLYLKIAASISVIAITFFLGRYVKDFPAGSTVARSEDLVTKSTEKGQKLTIHLSDGSKVMLNSGSTVTYSRNFNDNVRLVRMTGEAYFEVAKNPLKPFVVKTNRLSTTALGTSFTVSAYDDEVQEVCLLTGKVNVELNSDRTRHQVLVPGYKAVLSGKEAKTIKKDLFNEELETGWKDGLLYFEKTPFTTVVRKLEQWYGVDIKVAGHTPDNLYSSSKFKNDYLSEVLISLGYSLDFEFEIQDDQVFIKFNRKN